MIFWSFTVSWFVCSDGNKQDAAVCLKTSGGKPERTLAHHLCSVAAATTVSAPALRLRPALRATNHNGAKKTGSQKTADSPRTENVRLQNGTRRIRKFPDCLRDVSAVFRVSNVIQPHLGRRLVALRSGAAVACEAAAVARPESE